MTSYEDFKAAMDALYAHGGMPLSMMEAAAAQAVEEGIDVAAALGQHEEAE